VKNLKTPLNFRGVNVNVKNKSISVREIIEYFDLEILVDGDLDRRIDKNKIYRIGYELTGFFSDEISELKDAIHIMGLKENNYLYRMETEKKTEILDKYLSYPFPVLILSSRAKHIDILTERSKKNNKVLLRCSKRATEFIRELNVYLENVLGREIILEDHILLDVYGIGILLSGEKDLKIGATIELLERGHKFITDARMLLKNTADGIIGYNTAAKISPDRDFMLEMTDKEENINVTNNFGIKSTRPSKKINLIINLETWKTKKFYDRLGADEFYEDVGIGKLKKITLPARKGRNLAVIIETAAIDFRLKELGRNSALYFLNESKKLIQENKRKRESDEMEDETRLSMATFIKDNDIEVLIGEEYAHKSFITTTSIHKPAMALSGIFDLEESIYENKGLQLFTDVELKYLKMLSPEKRMKNLNRYFTYDFPAIVVCGDINVQDDIKYEVRKLMTENKKVLLRVKETNPSYVVANLNGYLEKYFSPSTTVHGVFLEMNGFGVLLKGKSGIGKSETALELIHRGHRLIADDMVKFKKVPNGEIIGSAAKLPYFMEIRGLGIIDIKTLYGMSSVRIKKNIDIIIELKEQENDNYLTAVDDSSLTEKILGKDIYKLEMYLSSGRNAAAMVEIVIMNLMAKKTGHNPEEAYKKLKKELGIDN